MKKIFISYIFLNVAPLFSMVPGYNYTNDDFIKFADNFEESKSCCAILSQDARSQLSGVLVTKNLVATAAHGLTPLFQRKEIVQTGTGFVEVRLNETYVQFDKTKRVRVKSAYVDQRYLFEEDKTEFGKYDIAFLRLEYPVLDRRSIPLEENLDVPKDPTFIVISHGTSDLSSFWDYLTFWKPSVTFLKRAFSLLEWTPFVSSKISNEDVKFIRTLLYSSIFFDARKTYRPYDINAAPIHQRTMDAIANWKNNGQSPFALSLPGTSGSPVFLKIEGKLHLIGLVVAYAPLNGQFSAPKGTSELDHILRNPKRAIGQYQTVLALFYKQNTLQNSKFPQGKYFVMDETVKRITDRK